MKRHLIAVLCVKLGAVLLLPAPAHVEQITGPATVHDGDTIKINGESVRLYGIDAP
jgi:endonuclease YncB( thermonuclease family)